ncbi:MAG: SLBB domain-containing protein, partial [Fimbriimonadales bacterium]|nr:SLBB domain-containing protein [Fimbriimonadales bacterium]
MHSIWEKLELRERAILITVYAASLGLALLLGYGWGRGGTGTPLQTAGLQTSGAVEIIDLSKPAVQPVRDAPADATEAADLAPPTELVVHVAGAVKKAGVYRLAQNSRVGDAIEQAGGATANADLDALNLAEPLADGQKIYVPRKGETPTPVVSTAHTPSRTDRAEKSAPPQFPINLNTATAEQLEAIPGVG